MRSRLALLVLAKAPEPGRVKTRLCPPATPDEAADLAAAALLDTLDAIRAVPGGRPVVALTGCLLRAVRSDELTAALHGVPTPAQRGDGLGERIAAAHADTHSLAPGLPTLQLGMDTPQVTAELLADSAAPLLEAHPAGGRPVDAVLGLATDGGWWALGLRHPLAARVIADVPTSQDDTGKRTLHALRAAGLTVALLPELTDVDTAESARDVAATAPATRFAATLAGIPAMYGAAPTLTAPALTVAGPC